MAGITGNIGDTMVEWMIKMLVAGGGEIIVNQAKPNQERVASQNLGKCVGIQENKIREIVGKMPGEAS